MESSATTSPSAADVAETEKETSFLPANLGGWLDLFVKSAAVFAGAFAIYQYLDAREDLRVARTLEYVERFNNPGTSVGSARADITRTLWANEPQIRRLRDILRALPEEDRAALRYRFTRKILDGGPDSEGAQPAVHAIVQFFDALHICIRSELCDKDSAHAFFGHYAETFWSNFGAAVIENRELDASYGAGLEHIARDAAVTPGLEPPLAEGV